MLRANDETRLTRAQERFQEIEGLLADGEVASDPVRSKKLAKEYSDKFASPYQAARKGMITDVIEPAQTRAVVSLALRNTLSKRETRPPKKHGNIPL